MVTTALKTIEKGYHASTINALSIGEYELEFLCKSYKPSAWVSRCGDQNLGVSFTSMRILIINVGPGHCCIVILQLDIMSQLGFFPSELCWQRFALCSAQGFLLATALSRVCEHWAASCLIAGYHYNKADFVVEWRRAYLLTLVLLFAYARMLCVPCPLNPSYTGTPCEASRCGGSCANAVAKLLDSESTRAAALNSESRSVDGPTTCKYGSKGYCEGSLNDCGVGSLAKSVSANPSYLSRNAKCMATDKQA